MLNAKQKNAKSKAKAYFFGPEAIAAMMGETVSAADEGFKNIVGIGVGPKITGGAITHQDSIHVYVRVKIPNSQLPAHQEVPPQFGSLPTDVIEVGDITACQTTSTWQRRNRNRPVVSCGVSIGGTKTTAGTLGCLVKKNNQSYILSNNHVIADTNTAKMGDEILQPGIEDGGSLPSDQIAILSEFKPIDFSGTANDIDAAIALVFPNSPVTIEPEIIGIGKPAHATQQAVKYQSVRKHGRTTGHTIGVVMGLSEDVWVRYSTKRALFENQLAVIDVGYTPFAQAGDSGSLIVDAIDLAPVALLFATGNRLTFANPIDPVLQYFQVNLA